MEFFVSMIMTYDQILPFLKVFHLTLCIQMRHRKEEGWMIQYL